MKPAVRVGDILSFPPDASLWGVVAIDARGYVLVPIDESFRKVRTN